MIFNHINILTIGHYRVFKLTGLYSMLKSVVLALYLFVKVFAINIRWMVVPRCIIGKVRLLPAAILIFRFDKCNIIPSIYGDLLRKDAVLLLPYYLCRHAKYKRSLILLHYKILSLCFFG